MLAVKFDRETGLSCYTAICDYCHKPFDDIEDAWFTWAEPHPDTFTQDHTYVPLLHLHAKPCINDWLYYESRSGKHQHVRYGTYQLKDMLKNGDVNTTLLDPNGCQPPTHHLTLTDVQAYMDSFYSSWANWQDIS